MSRGVIDMLKQLLNFENDFGGVEILKETAGFTVKYSLKKCPGVYHCRVNNTVDYDKAVKQFNRCRGILKRRETISRTRGK